ncbi:MAG: hypothetical protein KQH67_07235 [Bacteroidetes bacterium]|nr:hypothetical protein [Bacteroidota bacterium]
MMKKQSTTILLIMAIATGILWLNSCKKEQPTQQPDISTVDENSEAILSRILDFKQNMEYYLDHPEIRSEEKIQKDTTIIFWESCINLTYCYSYLNLADAVVYDTVIALPPITQDSIFMMDVSSKYYNEILYAVKAQYMRAPFSGNERKLMGVDLEKTTSGDSLHIISMIGHNVSMAHPPYDWMYGDYLGTCDGQHYGGISDAAHVIANNTRNHFYVAPPSNCRWFFNNIQTFIVEDPTLYPNPNDPAPVNYEDYLIYYASSAVGTITNDVLCLEHYDELAFYKQSYINLSQGWISNSGGRKFKDCIYTGLHEVDNDNFHKYKHNLITLLGYRGIECNTSIEDISVY